MQFENSVNQYGTQAEKAGEKHETAFENSVNQYGTQAERKLIGLVCNGTQINGVAIHASERMIDRAVTAEQIKDALLNLLKCTDVKADKLGRNSFLAIGKEASVAINLDNGVLTSIWTASSKSLRKLLERKKDG